MAPNGKRCSTDVAMERKFLVMANKQETNIVTNLLGALRLIAAAAAFTFLSLPVAAQKPPVVLVVGFPPGGTSDAVARILAQRLPAYLGTAVIVENKPGALGSVAVNEVGASRDKPAFILAPSAAPVFGTLEERLKIDIFKDLQPVAGVAKFAFGVAANGALGVKTPQDLMAWMRSGKRASFGVAGAGGISDLLAGQVGKAAGQESTVVPYQGNGPMIKDLMAGHIPFGVMVAGEVTAFLADEKVRLIGVLSPRRSDVFENVPTFREYGIPIAIGEDWYAIWGSPAVPSDDIEKMRAAVESVLALREVKDALTKRHAMSVDYQSGEVIGERLKSSFAAWKAIRPAQKPR